MHGGKSIAGPLHPSFKDGRRSRYAVPLDILASYDEARSDPELHDLTEEIALVTARVNLLFRRLDTGESAETWKSLHDVWGRFMVAVRDKDADRQADHVRELDQLFRRSRDDRGIWSELLSVIDQRKRLVETDVRTRVAKQQMITIDSALVHLTILASAIKEAAFKYADEDAAKRIIVDTSHAYRTAIGEPIDR